MRPLITPKGSKGIEQENTDGPTHSISLFPPAIHSSRRSKLIDAGAMYVCVLLLPAAIITVLYITQMQLLLMVTLFVLHCCCIDAISCNQFLQLLFHHTFS
jgi:hypothetical protein